VFQVHEWAQVRELHRQGVSKKAIARRLGMSRNTVSRLLASDQPPRYERRPAGSQLDPFKASVLAMLKDDADVAATVIRERLQQRGYAGGITILKDYLAKVRPQTGGTPASTCPWARARRDALTAS
jgi:transposase